MRGARTPITIKNMEPDFADEDHESEGIWTNQGVETVVYGSVHQKISDDVNEATVGQLSEERNLICRIPLGANITYGDQIVLSTIHPVLDGTYEIDALMYTKTHIRVECRRTMR